MNHLVKKAFFKYTCRIALPFLAMLLATITLSDEQGEPPPLPELSEKEAAILEAVTRARAGDESTQVSSATCM